MKNSTLAWLWKVPGRKKLYIIALTALQSLHGASGVLYAFLLREIVDAAAGGNRAGFWHAMSLTLLMVACQLILRAAIRWLSELSRSSLENTFKSRLMDTLLHRDYLQVHEVHSAEWMNRLTNDSVIAANACVDIVPGLAGMAVKLISALTVMLILEPRFGVIIIPGGAALLLFTWLFRRILKRMHKNVQEADGRLRIFLQESISSMLMVRSFAAEGKTREDADRRMKEHQDFRMKRSHFSNLSNLGFGAAMHGMYLLGLGWCGYGILTGSISFGTLTAITQLISQIQTPFAQITGYLPRYYALLASAERLMEAESFGEDMPEARPIDEIKRFYDEELESIGFDDVLFTFYVGPEGATEMKQGDVPVVLHDLSLEIKKGEYVAFTGASGCGKSTALKLLMCVYQPDSGLRYYTDRSGVRGELDSSYRRLFAYVPQGNALMNGSIRDVVSLAEPEAAGDDERLMAALRTACAEDFVMELEKGVDTLLGEHGTGLSEGQLQRLAIARAIFSESPVLLLDESTSALDMETERQLLDNLRRLENRTVVIVTHRTAALDICDRVLEFTENRVVSHEKQWGSRP